MSSRKPGDFGMWNCGKSVAEGPALRQAPQAGPGSCRKAALGVGRQCNPNPYTKPGFGPGLCSPEGRTFLQLLMPPEGIFL